MIIVALMWLTVMVIFGILTVVDKWEWIDQILPEDGEEQC